MLQHCKDYFCATASHSSSESKPTATVRAMIEFNKYDGSSRKGFTMEEGIRFDKVVICAETFGDPAKPAIVLIMGAASSSVWWDHAFCTLLAEKGFFVIRYDNRDTGKSTSYPPGEPGYAFEELADDAIHVLDHYGIERAVFMGMSMGGMLAQMIAVRHPERVSGIVLLASMYFAEGAEDLPGWSEEVDEFFKTYGQVEPETDEEVVEYALRQWQVTNKSSRPKDIAHTREMIWVDLQRAVNYASRVNHSFAEVTGDDLARIGEIDAPTLILHGTEDAVIPYVHGLRLAETIPHTRLVTFEGAGHELNPQDYDEAARAIVETFLPSLE